MVVPATSVARAVLVAAHVAAGGGGPGLVSPADLSEDDPVVDGHPGDLLYDKGLLGRRPHCDEAVPAGDACLGVCDDCDADWLELALVAHHVLDEPLFCL